MSSFIIIFGTTGLQLLDNLKDGAVLGGREYLLAYDSPQIQFYTRQGAVAQSMICSDNDNRFVAAYGESPPPAAVSNLNSGDFGNVFRSRHDFRGVVAIIDKLQCKLVVANDILGAVPLYYWLSPDGTAAVIGTRFRDVYRVARSSIDELGVYQFICAGYTVGSRTLAQEVRQLLPAESILFSTSGSKVSFTRELSAELWIDHKSRRLSADNLQELEALWREETGRLVKAQLMFSAGWDSRTLLAGMVSNGLERSAVAYSHGDSESRELRLASAMSSEFSVRSQVQPLGAGFFSMRLMDDMLETSESTLFPYWAHASKWGRSEGYDSLTGGLFGGILGGHYSTPSVKQGVGGAAALLKYILGFNNVGSSAGNAIAAASMLLYPKQFISFWCVQDEVNDRWGRTFLEETCADIKEKLALYESLGRSSLDNIIEAFQVEHRGRQYMNGQINIARSYNNVINPFTNPDLLRTVTNIPLSYRVHNKVNRVLIKQLAPRLLEYPMAATLVKAKQPVLVQEGSRLARKAIEGARWSLYQSGQQSIRPNMGWVNFEFLRQDDFIPELIDSLQLPLWSKKKMMDFFESYPLVSMHPLFDMFMKIKTIDYRLSGW